MPVTKGAKRALRRDRRRAVINQKTREAYKEAVRTVRKDPTEENLRLAHSQIDRAAKKKVIHKNKAARLKSRLARFLAKQVTTTVKKIAKKKNLKVKKEGR